MATDNTKLPTKAALAAHPRAVIVLTASSKKPEDVIREFEWFDKEAQSTYYLELLAEQLKEELEEAPDYFLVADVSDTKNLTVDSLQVYHREGDEAKAYCSDWMQRVADDPSLLLHVPVKSKAKVEAVKPKATVKAEIKGRKSTAAAAVAGGNGATGKQPRKRASVAPKADDTKQDAPKPTPAALKRAAAKAASSKTPDPVTALLALASPLAGIVRRR